MVKRTMYLSGVLAACALVAVCVDVGTNPGVDPSESCADAAPNQRRCHEGDKLQICIEQGSEQVWETVLTCTDGQACFDAPLYSEPACLPLFDCYDTAVHYITCDYSGLQTIAEDDCHNACTSHAKTQDYAPLVNCYGTQCENAVDPIGCVLDSCQAEVSMCLAGPERDDPPCPPSGCPPPVRPMADPPEGGATCMDLASCYGACPDMCRDHCSEAAGEVATCETSCISLCQPDCRSWAGEEATKVFVTWGVCQMRHCHGLIEEQMDLCMWTHCAEDTAQCLASAARGSASCQETFQCLTDESQDGFSEAMECIASGTAEGTENALNLLACALKDLSRDGACASERGRAEIQSCLEAQCKEHLTACAL